MGFALDWMGRELARYLSAPGRRSMQVAIDFPEAVANALRPGDVLLVDGNTRIATAIKYLTQSTWSHAALYVGEALGTRDARGSLNVLLEADVVEGVRAVALGEYARFATRICRPVGLSPAQTPPVPSRFRRRLIAQAFELVGYPILPEIMLEKLDDPACRDCYREIMHVRHHSLIAPRDFDISPYFAKSWRSSSAPTCEPGPRRS